jgi:predicted metal-dependent peptidase
MKADTKTAKNRAVEALCLRIWENCRDELFARFPLYPAALGGLAFLPSTETGSWGTDGESVFYAPDYVMESYRDCPAKVKASYLHMVFHCLFLHVTGAEERDAYLWNIACDMAVELSLRRLTGGLELLDPSPIEKECQEYFRKAPVSGEKLYEMLKAGTLPWQSKDLAEAFLRDDHSFWNRKADPCRLEEIKHKWEKITAYTSSNAQGLKKRAGTQKGNQKESMKLLRRGKYDYRRFLKRFAVPREEVELDAESFDYIFYHYGMEHYGNMPLVEPLEYKEGHKLEELVIAIDTSGSCSREMVQRFLEETYSMLSEKENFFRKMKVFIIQCDCYIQDVAKITSREDWKAYRDQIRIQGRGGTDFRPVFRYVEELRKKKEIRDLRALIYFTDGDGIYPREKPDYETAFVFLKEESLKQQMLPDWAVKLILEGGSHEY